MSPIPREQRVSRRQPCPICHHTDWCYFNPDHSMVVCMRVEDGAIKETANGGWLHRIGEGRHPPPPTPRPVLSPASRLQRHRVFKALIDELILSRRHGKQLLARGFSVEAIRRRRYRTLPEPRKASRASIARRVRRRSGAELEGVPGFYLHEGRHGPFWSLHGPPGLLIPVIDADGYIAGFQIRADRPGDGGKYRWLSSSSVPEGGVPGTGAPSGAPLHVSRPVQVRTDEVWITEGPLKADRAAESLGAVVVAVPGVSSWRDVPDLVQRLGATRVVVAFDMDLYTNPQVQRHMADMVTALKSVTLYMPDQDAEVPLRVTWARWDGQAAKGIDDALQAGVSITNEPL